MKFSAWSSIAAFLLLTVSATAIVFVVPAIGADHAGDKDFIAYWAAGQQLAHGGSPYDTAAVFRLEHGAGMTANRPNMLLNMPSAFFLVLPLGLVSAKTGMGIWLLAFIGCLMVSIRMLWILFGRQDNALHLFSYIFGPVMACMLAGQLGAFLLLGVVLFLYFHQIRPLWAGAALLLCALKPHLFLPFGVILLAWVFHRRAYRLLMGAVVSMIASLALSFFFAPRAWPEYVRLMHDNPGVQRDFVPVLSVVFRLLIDRNAVWLQYIPAVAGCCWCLWYFWTRRDRWSWMHHGLLVLLVSVACAPHAWFTDEVLLLPVILAALYRTAHRARVLVALCACSGIAAIEIAERLQITGVFYLWTVPAWFTLFLYATRHQNAAAKTTVPA